jgi:hypothetical protein
MTDSIGNQLPDDKLLLLPRDRNDSIMESIVLNTFLSACKIAMQNGHTVIYDKDKKLATITNLNGVQSTVSH